MSDPALDRYLAGTMSAGEREAMETRLSADPALASLVRRLPAAVAGTVNVADSYAAWQALASRIAMHDATLELPTSGDRVPSPAAARSRTVVPWLRTASRIAASLLIVAGVGITWRAVRSDARSIEAPMGRTVTATLPDGTRLTLAGGSRVSFGTAYGKPAREVQLEGEAFFDVVHDDAHPFRVRARDAVAEDIGTRFSVRAWPELRAVDVAVEEGIVALGDSGDASGVRPTELRAGQRGRLVNGQVAVSADVGSVLAWTRNELVFDNQPLREVLPAIARRFVVELEADPVLGDRRLTARFDRQPLGAVLEAVALSLGARLDTTGKRITLVPVAP
ncbi:MAG TPA: FecR domain-containing protein [Gemmatimonadaceae bacterium]|nr:FecR domain-containing protein [Gemmatimonadaceae bacterium]